MMQISGKTWARIGALAFVAFAILVSALSLRHGPAAPTALAIPRAQGTDAVADPLVGELSRCQSLGQAGATDPDCLRAWAENRRRFLSLGVRSAPVAAAGAPTMFPADGAAQLRDARP